MSICIWKRSMWLVTFCLFRVVIMWYTLDLPSTCHPGFQLQLKIYRNSPIPKQHPSPDGDNHILGFFGGIDLPFRIFFEVLFLTHSNHRNGMIRTLVNADALVTAQRLADDAWVCRSRERWWRIDVVVGYLGNDTGMIMVWEKAMSSQVALYIQHV